MLSLSCCAVLTTCHRYELFEEIGRGAFGVCRRAKVRCTRSMRTSRHTCTCAQDKVTGGEMCCKTIDKDRLTEEQLHEVEHEAEVMLHLRGHPNIVSM